MDGVFLTESSVILCGECEGDTPCQAGTTHPNGHCHWTARTFINSVCWHHKTNVNHCKQVNKCKCI